MRVGRFRCVDIRVVAGRCRVLAGRDACAPVITENALDLSREAFGQGLVVAGDDDVHRRVLFEPPCRVSYSHKLALAVTRREEDHQPFAQAVGHAFEVFVDIDLMLEFPVHRRRDTLEPFLELVKRQCTTHSAQCRIGSWRFFILHRVFCTLLCRRVFVRCSAACFFILHWALCIMHFQQIIPAVGLDPAGFACAAFETAVQTSAVKIAITHLAHFPLDQLVMPAAILQKQLAAIVNFL